MLTIYLTCLVAGGVFVALSVLGGLGDDGDGGFDKDVDLDSHFEGDGHVHGAFELDGEIDLDLDADSDLGGGHHGTLVDAAESAIALTDGRRGPRRVEPPKRPLWTHLLSFRFWTFGAAFFGLTGTLLDVIAGSRGMGALAASIAVGMGSGGASVSLVNMLRRTTDGDSLRVDDYRGQEGVLLVAMPQGQMGKVRFDVGHRQVDLLVAPDPEKSWPKGTRVVVLGLDEQGRARISADPELLALEES